VRLRIISGPLMGHDFLHATHGANQKCGLRMFTYYAAIVTIAANRPKNLGGLSPPLIYLFIYGHGMLSISAFVSELSRKQKSPLPIWLMRSLATVGLGITAKKRYTP